MKTWPPGFIDTILTSSPYFGLRDYDVPLVMWYPSGYQGCEHESWEPSFQKEIQLQAGNPEFQRPWREEANSKGQQQSSFCNSCNTWYGQLGHEPTFELFLVHLFQTFDECWRLLKPTGSLWIVLGDTYWGGGQAQGHTSHSTNFGVKTQGRNYLSQPIARGKGKGIKDKSLIGIPDRFKIGMIDRGWICRNDIIWHKPNAMPQSAKDKFTPDYERLFFFVKQGNYFFEQQFEPFATIDSLRESKRGKHNLKGGNRQGLDQWTVQYDYLKYINTPYTGKARKDYSTAKAQNPSDTKRRILESMQRIPARTKRTVWSITTKAYKGAHFAVFPPELVKTPILATCPQYICKRCSQPRKRIPMSKEAKGLENFTLAGLRKLFGFLGDDADFCLSCGTEITNGIVCDTCNKWLERKEVPPEYEQCSCNAGWNRGIIFDPFMGRGTVAKVAMDLGRDWLGIDLGEDYIKLANKYLGFDTSQGKRRGNLLQEFKI
ncbi:MAG: site-specific DNA-methyltransferase [Thermodesulfobacteriota bacterium]